MDRERIVEADFLKTGAIEGAQLKYTWKQLEPAKGEYDFAAVREDLAFLTAHGKRMFIQLQDVSFDASIVPIPKYLRDDPVYHGGANQQYDIPRDDEAKAVAAGWVARRWDPAVRERFQKLLDALGKEFDGKIEGINLPETAVDFGESGRLFPPDFSPATYREAILSNIAALKHAFPKSVTMQYANFMPEKRGETGHPSLIAVYEKAAELKVGVGGPDLLPDKPYQMANSYPLIRAAAGRVPTGIAIQEGNYAYRSTKTHEPMTVAALNEFATGYLKVDYIFWSPEEPAWTRQVLPFLGGQGPAKRR